MNWPSYNALTTFILTTDRPDPIVLSGARYQRSIELKELIDEYKQGYKQYRGLSKDANPKERENHPWRVTLPDWIERLIQILDIAAIENHLGNANQIILLPHRDLHLLPIHAGFSDRFHCTNLPSLQIGLNQSNRRPSQTAPTLLNIDDPAINQKPLVYSRLESAIIRALLGTNTYLTDTAATHVATISALQIPHRVFHFSGHGHYDEHRSEDSAIGLTDQPLTAKTVASLDLAAYDLISLAACETGIVGKDTITTEYVSLASAFLKARARAVLSTLWQVDELSSTWLMVRFYQVYLTGESPIVALAIAQAWLKTVTRSQLLLWVEPLQHLPNLSYDGKVRLSQAHADLQREWSTMDKDEPPYAHPFFWSAFTVIGGISNSP